MVQRVASTQKFPIIFIVCLAKPRIKTIATAIPTADGNKVLHGQRGHLHEVAQSRIG